MKMSKYLRDNSKKIMALVSVVLMVLWFVPNIAGRSTPAQMAAMTAATVYNGNKITRAELNSTKNEWELVRHRLVYLSGENDAQQMLLAPVLLGQATQEIDQSPGSNSFLLLIKEAEHLGVGVSTDTYKDLLTSHVGNLPTDDSPDYDLAQKAVYDLLLVRNLLDRVSTTFKTSQPRTLHDLAVTQQDISIKAVEFTIASDTPATQPTAAQVQNQYDRFGQNLAGQTTLLDPLGFGYQEPDRVKVQYLGFTFADLKPTVMKSKPVIDSVTQQITRLDPAPAGPTPIEWEIQARRLYRKNPAEFATPTTVPSTQPAASDWEHLPPDVLGRVYDRVYAAAVSDIARSIQDRLNSQLSSDWVAYHDAADKKLPAPKTSVGVAFNTDDYFRELAASIQKDIGVLPILGIADSDWKSSKDLESIPGISTAFNAANQKFADYATSSGDQFKSAAAKAVNERLSLWQPSQPVYTGTPPNSIDGYYVFRLSAMDPAHLPPLDEVRKQVIADIQTQIAWDAITTRAAKFRDVAKTAGVEAAAHDLIPAPKVITTDFFNPAQISSNGDKIPGMVLQPASARSLAQQSVQLLTTPPTETSHDVLEADLPLDREIAVIELNQARPQWQDASQRLMLQSMLAGTEDQQLSQGVEFTWANFDNVSKRTNFKEVGK